MGHYHDCSVCGEENGPGGCACSRKERREKERKVLIKEFSEAPRGSEALDRNFLEFNKISCSSDEEGNYGGYGSLPRRVQVSRNLQSIIDLIPEDYDWIIIKGNAGMTRSVQIGETDPCFGATIALAACVAYLERVAK